MKRITFITGYYGSGKTELALNLASKWEVDYLIDLDIINPYFRSREFKEKLNQTEVIASDLKDDQYADLPYLSKKIFLPFHQIDKTAIYDLGGSDLGAKVMKQFSKEDMHDVDLWLVINVFRPETKDVKAIIHLITSLELYSGVPITGLVNNSNLLKETTVNDIKRGDDVLKAVSKHTHIPIICTCIDESLDITCASCQGKVMSIKRFFGKKWRS